MFALDCDDIKTSQNQGRPMTQESVANALWDTAGVLLFMVAGHKSL